MCLDPRSAKILAIELLDTRPEFGSGDLIYCHTDDAAQWEGDHG
jgi:hypothetical protein